MGQNLPTLTLAHLANLFVSRKARQPEGKFIKLDQPPQSPKTRETDTFSFAR